MTDFTSLKARIVEGTPRGPTPVSREGEFATHMADLRGDFAGRPELCVHHAALIVRIRRRMDLERDVPAFLELWEAEHAFLAEHLDSRWLVSACDTFADHGTAFQRAAAVALAALINTTRLCETERILSVDPSFDPRKFERMKAEHRDGRYVELWDGVSAYTPHKGDTPRNLFRRLFDVVGMDPALDAIGRTLLGRALAEDTLLGRLARMNPGFLPEP